ncbi:dipeptide/oligopeptide/nickel ABC transporter ATP-binding protein [Canibacter zhoujuaniae]|uniref:ABC transporter ATP-binding protein n=1 Tax=Canibacter zhoujuaniae TaxID=2708343 RepID=UPI001421086B|nr:dipeptide/oligopeptide/nickel ABC transporter ATP-binding protein [Canibacter zhoujuaniae]
MSEPLFEVKNLTVDYGSKKPALRNVSLTVEPGERLAIVGPSGSGKTTLLRCLVGIEQPTTGTVRYRGEPVGRSRASGQRVRRETGFIAQDPQSSFNPLLTVESSLWETATAHLSFRARHRARAAVRARTLELLQELALSEDSINRYPHEFSGGQRQRIAIARALITDPTTLVADEPVSALDVLARQRFVATLLDVVASRELTLITVTHDLTIVPNLATRLIELRNGAITQDTALPA